MGRQGILNLIAYRNLIIYCEELLNLCPISELENHPFSVVRDLFNIFAATLRLRRKYI
jgi:hypothetical protein